MADDISSIIGAAASQYGPPGMVWQSAQGSLALHSQRSSNRKTARCARTRTGVLALTSRGGAHRGSHDFKRTTAGGARFAWLVCTQRSKLGGKSRVLPLGTSNFSSMVLAKRVLEQLPNIQHPLSGGLDQRRSCHVGVTDPANNAVVRRGGRPSR